MCIFSISPKIEPKAAMFCVHNDVISRNPFTMVQMFMYSKCIFSLMNGHYL